MNNKVDKDVRLDEDYTNIDIRHLMSPARIAALRGADPEQQAKANWHGLTMRATGLAGAIGGAWGGAELGKKLYNKTPEDQVLGAIVGGGLGLVTGGLLGQYLSFKALSYSRGTDSTYRPRHLLEPARIAALQGSTPQEQVEANWDDIKMGGGSILGSAVGGRFGIPFLDTVGGLGAYKVLKDNRLKKK